MLSNSKQMSHDSHGAALACDWLVFFSSMARTKITPMKGKKGKPKKVKTRAEVHVQPGEPPVLAEHPVPELEFPPTLSEMERRRAEAEKLEEVAGVVTNPTVGPDVCKGWVINVG